MSKSSPTSPVFPLAPYPPLPSPELRSRAPEFYGFVAWTSTAILFILYVLWALLPDAYIESVGVNWYPNREWALLLPAYSIVIVLLTYFIYFALAISGTPAFSEMRTIIDSKAQLPVEDDSPNPYITYALDQTRLELYDIPIGMVNRVLFSKPQKSGTEGE